MPLSSRPLDPDPSRPPPLPADWAPPVPPVAVPVIPLEPSLELDVAAPTRRFCNSCGAAWDPLWTDCPHCAARLATPISVGGPSITGRPVASALGLYFTVLGTLLAGAVIIRIAGPDAATNVEIGLGILDAIIVTVWCTATPQDVLPLLGNLASARWYALALAAVPITFGLATVTIAFLVKVGGLTTIEYVRPVFDAGYGWPTVILLVCVQPAIVEELAFRGVILSGMRQVLSDNEAIVVSALLFMIIHLSFLSFPHLVLLGLVLGFMRVRSGSLYPGMLAHFAHNLAAVLTDRWFT